MKKYTRLKTVLSGILIAGFLLILTSGKLERPISRPEEQEQDFILLKNPNGPTLGYSARSGVKILSVNGLAFKDLNKNGKLDPYEDWRLPVDLRAKDLAAKMSVEQIAGLMLYSRHQAIPSLPGGPTGPATYNGKTFDPDSARASDISDQQRSFLLADNLRHILVTMVQSPETAAQWNNNVQALVEGSGLGIPVNNSSDPRHGTNSGVEYTAGAGGKISQWPDELGLAATFDPAVVQQFGTIAGKEYRALGISTALSPQIDLGDLLRTKYGYDGVVCTDWLVTADEGKTPEIFAGKSWGMETKTVAERHYKILMAGVDQFGGNNLAGPVIINM